eukprot:1161343-Pelagomonas_calceolata.AAC.2
MGLEQEQAGRWPGWTFPVVTSAAAIGSSCIEGLVPGSSTSAGALTEIQKTCNVTLVYHG